MQTKLIYVLTCTPEATYIEQALISIWSARYHNPDAHIVLLLDDLTNQLLVGKRAEILEYISEKRVVSFDDSQATMMYRSRFIKTQVRNLVDGNILFIDCDTIIAQSLSEIDKCSSEIAMVLDEHLRVYEYNDDLKEYLQSNSLKLGYDVLKENEYFNSGVIYSKDSDEANKLWELWHKYWCYGEQKGVAIDQPALGKANMQCNHIIQQLPREWNTLVYMNPIFIFDGRILHFWNFRNRSFIFCKPFLTYVRLHGLDDYVKDCLLHPLRSVFPSDNILNNCSLRQCVIYSYILWKEKRKYIRLIDKTLSDFPWNKRYNVLYRYLKIKLLRKGNFSDIYYS